MKGVYLTFEERTIKKIEEITNTDYEFVGNKLLVDTCIDIIEDLIMEFEDLKEEYDDYKTYIEDNYTQKKYWEEL